VATTITGSITGTSLSITIASSTGWPTGAEFYAVIDPGTATEEKILCTRSGTTLTLASTAKRGVDGTAAASHASGAAIYPCIAAADIDEPNAALSKITTEGDILVHGAADFQRLGIGSNGLPLVVNTGVSGKLQYAQVTTTGIADDAITSAKIAADAVGASEIATGAVGTTEIADNAVTAAKLAAAVAGDGLAGGGGSALSVNVDGTSIAITTDTLGVAANGITAAKIATAVAGNGLSGGGGSALSVNVDSSTIIIAGDTLSVGTITSGNIGASQVGSTQIAAGAVTSGKIGTDAVGASNIVDGAVGASEIAAGAISATHMASSSVATAAIQDDAVTSAKIAADAVGTSEIAANAVTSTEILNGAVTRAKMSTGRAGTWRRASSYQSIATGDATAILIDNEDSDPMGWCSGTTFTCPEDGVYAFTFLLKFQNDQTSAMAIIQNYTTSEEWRAGAGSQYTSQALANCITIPVTSGQQIVFRAWHQAGSNQNVNARINISYVCPI
jgi:hypothetical protein